MSGKTDGIKLVVVESPTKAKTIRKFLGKEYQVESCMGHVRDLPSSAKDIPEKLKKEKWAQLGVNVDQEFEPIYCIPKEKSKVVKNLKDKLADASELYLATDEDREGESISWHLKEILKPKVPTKRMVFHEITKEAIQKSLKETRDIDLNLVRAQEARRILDRLVGYTISPLLWKKVAYGLSAGRVQSVAVRLIAEREMARIRFHKSQYWGVEAQLDKSGNFTARLIEADGKKIAMGKDFDPDTGQLRAEKDLKVLDQNGAQKIAANALKAAWEVASVEEKPVSRKPAAPFITSTLQQEANRKLGMGARETMQVAQKLYEQGFITYMRTDSTALSQEALQAARNWIGKEYGKEYLPPSPRLYEGKKVKGAQEAHEAIRPAGNEFVHPESTGLDGQQLKLYELIWKRTVASQMVDSRQLQVSVKILARVDGTENVFSASGTTIEFPGYLRAYVEGSDDPDAELAEREVRLPKLSAKDKVLCRKADPTQHETKPPSRFTEASLVQTMEKEGIGRPSTYASVISTIIDRGYVKKQGNALAPTFTAMVVSKLLSQHLPEYVDLGFTSEMEQSLDNIAEGDLKWEKYLASIYHGPKGLRALVDGQEKNIDPEEARSIRLDGLKNVTFHVGRFGAYMTALKDGQEVRASIPETESPADFTNEVADRLIEQKLNGADSLGKDPVSGLPVYALNGRYGPYVQLGDAKDEDKPKRASLLPGMKLEDVTLEQALGMLALPKTLGAHPETKKDIKVGIGRFGPYVVHDGDFRSIPKGEDVFHLSFARAMELLSLPKKGRGKQAPLKVFGVHPQLQEEIQLLNGKYGPYLKSGKVNASLPEGVGVDALDEKQAIAILNARIEVLPPAKVKGAKAKTSKASKASASADSTSGPAKKADSKPAKKAAAKKPPQKKPASQKEVANKTEVKVKVRKK